MEFKALKNIESSFRQIRLYAIIFLGCWLCGGPTALPKRSVRKSMFWIKAGA